MKYSLRLVHANRCELVLYGHERTVAPGEPLAARYNWCQGAVPDHGPAFEKHWPSLACKSILYLGKPFELLDYMKIAIFILSVYILHLGAITWGYHPLRSNPAPYTKPEPLVGWGVCQYTWRQWWLRQEFHQCRGRRWWGSYREECWQSCSTHKNSPKDVTTELPFGVLCPRGWWNCCLHVHHSSEQVFCQ